MNNSKVYMKKKFCCFICCYASWIALNVSVSVSSQWQREIAEDTQDS